MYSTALYGSSLWQLNSGEHLQLNRSWNTAMKIIWDLPYATHTRFLESLTVIPHLESVLNGRYVGFVNNLLHTEHSLLGLLFSSCKDNVSTQTGQNIRYLLDKHKRKTLADLVVEKQTLKRYRVHDLPQEEAWKINLLKEITYVKKDQLEVQFDDKHLEDILMHICTA